MENANSGRAPNARPLRFRASRQGPIAKFDRVSSGAEACALVGTVEVSVSMRPTIASSSASFLRQSPAYGFPRPKPQKRTRRSNGSPSLLRTERFSRLRRARAAAAGKILSALQLDRGVSPLRGANRLQCDAILAVASTLFGDGTEVKTTFATSKRRSFPARPFSIERCSCSKFYAGFMR